MNTPDPKRIAICGVRYSPNLGDGVISDCLGWMIEHVLPEGVAVNLDLAGRTSFGEETVSGRRQKLKFLLSLPESIQNLILRALLGRKIKASLQPHWSEVIRSCDAALIGGGQLLSDSDLNFPLKIRGLLECLRRQAIPTVYYACGVTCRGAAGARILGESLRDPLVKGVYLRDEKSMKVVGGFLKAGEMISASHAFDPAIHVAEAYQEHLTGEPVFDVGVNFTDPVNMSYSSGRTLPYVDGLGATMAEVVRSFVAAGKRVALFTNGATEDEEFLDQTDQEFRLSESDGVRRIPRPIEPMQLVQSIHRMQSVIAHRLHTNIIAFGLRIPSVGLEWSQKVPHFFQLVGREACLVGKDEMTSEQILARHASLGEHGVDADLLDRMKTTSLKTLQSALSLARN
ncbi:MAG: polysaccharide pyruvyl transferase family protein [Planctomycetota bacterium]